MDAWARPPTGCTAKRIRTYRTDACEEVDDRQRRCRNLTLCQSHRPQVTSPRLCSASSLGMRGRSYYQHRSFITNDCAMLSLLQGYFLWARLRSKLCRPDICFGMLGSKIKHFATACCSVTLHALAAACLAMAPLLLQGTSRIFIF